MTDGGVVRGRLTEGTDQPPVQPQQHADAPAPALHTDEEQSIDSSWINAGSSQLTLSASGISGKSPDIPQGAQNTPKPALYAGRGSHFLLSIYLSFSAVSRPIFASKYAFTESGRGTRPSKLLANSAM